MSGAARLGAVLLGAAILTVAGCKPQPVVDGVAAKQGNLVSEKTETVVVELSEVDDTMTSDAVVEATRQSTVSAQIAGRIIDVGFDVGDYVKQGEVIVRIDARTVTQAAVASEAQVRQAQAELANARAQLERTRALVAQTFLSPSALDRAEAEAKAAQARVTALLAGADVAQTERGFARVVAPYSGIVSARHVEVGEMAVVGKPLMSGFDPGALRVVAHVPQSSIALIQNAASARIEVPSAQTWFESDQITVLPTVDPLTHTAQVRITLKDGALSNGARGLLPGVFARAHFVVGQATRLRVPTAAVLRRSEVTAVYVVDEHKRAHLRQVRLGAPLSEQWIEVLAGLKAGERVVLNPSQAMLEP